MVWSSVPSSSVVHSSNNESGGIVAFTCRRLAVCERCNPEARSKDIRCSSGVRPGGMPNCHSPVSASRPLNSRNLETILSAAAIGSPEAILASGGKVVFACNSFKMTWRIFVRSCSWYSTRRWTNPNFFLRNAFCLRKLSFSSRTSTAAFSNLTRFRRSMEILLYSCTSSRTRLIFNDWAICRSSSPTTSSCCADEEGSDFCSSCCWLRRRRRRLYRSLSKVTRWWYHRFPSAVPPYLGGRFFSLIPKGSSMLRVSLLVSFVVLIQWNLNRKPRNASAIARYTFDSFPKIACFHGAMKCNERHFTSVAGDASMRIASAVPLCFMGASAPCSWWE